jgi:hypothetical protein
MMLAGRSQWKQGIEMIYDILVLPDVPRECINFISIVRLFL